MKLAKMLATGVSAVVAFGLGASGAGAAAAGESALEASAAVPGYQIVSATGPTNSVWQKFVTITCPVGKYAISAGAEVLGGGSDVFLTGIRPGGPAATVSASEVGSGTAANWTLRGWAVCANALAGMVVVTNTSSQVGIPGARWGQVQCPAGRSLVGAGAYVEGPGGSAIVRSVQLHTTAAYTEAAAPFGQVVPFGLVSVAVCAAPLAGQQRALSYLETTSPSTATLTKPCNAGQRLVGIGFNVGHTAVGITRVVPSATAATVTAHEIGWGTNEAWGMNTYTMCATA